MTPKPSHLVALVAVAACLFLGWLVYDRSSPPAARVATPGPAAATAGLERAANQNDVPASPANASRTPEPPAHQPDNPAAALRALWADPGFRASSVQKNIVDLEARYGRFFLSLAHLPPEQLAALKRLMATQSMARAEIQLPRESPESPAATAARLAALDQLQRTQEEELRAALGDAAYLDLEIARHAEPYRDTVAALANGMRSRGVALDDARQERMLEAYTGAMLELGNELQRNPDRSPPPATEAERLAQRNRQLERARALLTRSMGEVLDSAALEAFLATQLSRETGP